MSIIPPNHTIYVQNINDQIKLETRRKMLYVLFSKCGEVVDIMTRPGSKYRGQAWVVYKNIADSTRALQQLNHTLFYGKQLKLFYAKTKSDIISKADGSYISPQDRAQHPKDQPVVDSSAAPTKRPLQEEVESHADREMDEDPSLTESIKKAKNMGLEAEHDNEELEEPASPQEEDTTISSEPKRWLLATGFPSGADTAMLQTFFKDKPGFIDVKLTNNKQQAILEFDTTENAVQCRNTMNRHRFDLSHRLKLDFLQRTE